ncbi:MAG TPA: trimethylamine methyltransferase family protein [Pseudomonadales bacterium]|nr:trimethylamine methyltransferase family protein [Pseudomonadales bacterium]MDP7314070.1 trimethylamine methyltransferase family protein [Pseudomonadales bacterium]MDP7451359.1 trimethylamine methyltransferase family protein [Arenicellales bacterium]HJP50155.1 trimethylamine methyltransferase family protein [Pseudomonadales bacterium]
MRRGIKTRRENPISASAVAPGMIGGRYNPLTESDLARIHETVLTVLETIGMGDPIEILRERALARGCWMNEHDRLCFPRALVEDVIATTPKEMFFLGRKPQYDLELGGHRVHTYGGGEAVNVLDVGTRHYRPSTLLDVYDAARLVDTLDNIHAFSRLIVATEIEDQLICDINTAYASVAGTAKHTALTFSDHTHVAPTLEMLKTIAGGEKQWLERPFCHGGGCPVISPLRYGRDNSEVCVESIKFGAPVWIVVAPQAGATAPAALAGAVVQCVAEAIASVLLVDLVSPGYPVVIGPWPFVSDLRTGAFTGGSGEEALVSAAAAQVINHYGLVSSVGAGMTDAKIPDNQAGFEKGIAVALAALTGCNNVSESAGMIGSLMGLSLEAMVIDNDMLGAVMRTVRGIEVNDATLSLEVMAETVKGDGHYLRHPQTLEIMRTEYEYPALSDRRTLEDWQSAGSPDIRDQAAIYVKETLSSHYPLHIDADTDQKIRERFPIILPAHAMQPGNGRW